MLVNTQREPAERLLDTCANVIKAEGGGSSVGERSHMTSPPLALNWQIADTLKKIQLPQIMKLDIQIKLE